MAFTQAIYYPSIDISDEAWLKTSLLYWDSIRTIVPEAIRSPYSSDTARALQDVGFLVPLRVQSDMGEIRDLASDVLTYLATEEGGELLVSGIRQSRGQYIHVDKLAHGLMGPMRPWMHSEKFSHEVFQRVARLSDHSGHRPEWVQVEEGFALFYMTLLASRLADRIGAALLTPLPVAERLAITARLDAQFSRISLSFLDDDCGWWRTGRAPGEYDAFGPRRPMPGTLARGLLSQLAIERVAVDPDTPIDVLMRCKEEPRAARALFRTKIEELTSAVEGPLPMEALRQRIQDVYANECEPAISNLKKALDGNRIRWMGGSLMKIAFLSGGSSMISVAAHLDVPTALLASAGLSLVVSMIMYNIDKREILRTCPYSYLLSLEREFA